MKLGLTCIAVLCNLAVAGDEAANLGLELLRDPLAELLANMFMIPFAAQQDNPADDLDFLVVQSYKSEIAITSISATVAHSPPTDAACCFREVSHG